MLRLEASSSAVMVQDRVPVVAQVCQLLRREALSLYYCMNDFCWRISDYETSIKAQIRLLRSWLAHNEKDDPNRYVQRLGIQIGEAKYSIQGIHVACRPVEIQMFIVGDRYSAYILLAKMPSKYPPSVQKKAEKAMFEMINTIKLYMPERTLRFREIGTHTLG